MPGGWARRLVAVVGLAGLATACNGTAGFPKPAVSQQFAVGQVWKYRTRPGEESSRVIVGRIETIPSSGTVVHVKLVRVRIRNFADPESSSPVVGHAPISEAQLAASVTELTAEAPDLEGFEEGYRLWLDAFRREGAGVFSIPLAEIVEYIEVIINQQRPPTASYSSTPTGAAATPARARGACSALWE